MNEKIQERVNHSYLCSIGANKLSKYELAQVLKSEMLKQEIGTDKLSQITGIPRSTIRNHLEFLKYSKEDVKMYERGKITIPQLRAKYNNKSEYKNTELTKIDFQLKETIDIVNSSIRHTNGYGKQTLNLIDDLIKTLNTYKFRIQKENK